MAKGFGLRVRFPFLFSYIYGNFIALIKSGTVAAGLGVGVVLVGNWLEGNMGNNSGVKEDTGEQTIQDIERLASQDMGRQTPHEMGRSVGQDLKAGQNSSKLKPVEKLESAETDQDNQLPPEDKTLTTVNQSSCGTVEERSTDQKIATHQQSEDNVEKMSQFADCDYSLPTEPQSPNSAVVGHRHQLSSDRTFRQQLAHLVWVGLRLSQILLSILLPTTLIFLRWM